MTAYIPDVSPGGYVEYSWGNLVRNRVIMPFASAAVRATTWPTPTVGQMSWLIDTRRLEIYDASGWRTVWTQLWTTFTPTITPSGAPLVLGNGQLRGRYRTIPPYTEVYMYFQYGSSSANGAGSWTFSLPVVSIATEEQWLECKIGSLTTGTFMGKSIVGPSSAATTPEFPTSASDGRVLPFQQSNNAGTAGTGIPQAAGVYPLSSGSNLIIWGRYMTS